MTANKLRPRDGIKMAESHPELTPKEREKILAISLIQYLVEAPPARGQKAVEFCLLWGFSQGVAKTLGYKIPDLNIPKAIMMHRCPKNFECYR